MEEEVNSSPAKSLVDDVSISINKQMDKRCEVHLEKKKKKVVRKSKFKGNKDTPIETAVDDDTLIDSQSDSDSCQTISDEFSNNVQEVKGKELTVCSANVNQYSKKVFDVINIENMEDMKSMKSELYESNAVNNTKNSLGKISHAESEGVDKRDNSNPKKETEHEKEKLKAIKWLKKNAQSKFKELQAEIENSEEGKVVSRHQMMRMVNDAYDSIREQYADDFETME